MSLEAPVEVPMLQGIVDVSSFVSMLDKFKADLTIRGEPWNPWYRGHAEAKWRLLPSIYRESAPDHYLGYRFLTGRESF